MKSLMKLLALVLACLMLVTTFVACGGSTETETQKNGAETGAPETDSGKETDATVVEDDVPKDLRFNGETVTFFTRNDHDLWKYEMDVDTIMNDTLFDAIYYRNKTVEERLGVTIDTLEMAGTYAKRAEWNDALRTAVNTQTGDYDAAAIYMSTGSALAVEGMYYNVIDFPYINLNQLWWNKDIQEELTLFGTLYYLAGDIAITETAGGGVIFYNKDLFDKHYGAQGIDIYAEVTNGKWTIDRLHELASNVHEDLNGDGLVSEGDIVGYGDTDPSNGSDGSRDAWVAAMGLSITTMVNGMPELTFYNSRTIQAFEKIQNLYLRNPGTLALSGREVSTFSNGYVLFQRGDLNTGSSLREMKDRYGVLPMPMLDEAQYQDLGYQTSCVNTCSLITILSCLPESRKDVVGATIELMAAESYKQVRPAYFEVALKSKYSEDPNDAAMYDIVLDSFTFSFGYCYSTESLKAVGNMFRDFTADIAEKWDANDEVYEEKLQTLIDGLDEAAYKAMFG